MSCRGYGSHRSHAPLRLGDGSSLEHGGRCCCVKEDVSCEAAASERRSMPTAQYCRCGALRASSLDHLFIPEDLSIVPIHLKYSKDKFRGVRVDGRMYFLPNSQHFGRLWVGDSRRDQSRKETLAVGRDLLKRNNDYAPPSNFTKDIYKERNRTNRSYPDDWRSERRSVRQSVGRLTDDRRPKSRQTTNDRNSFVFTVNTGSKYQPPASRERRFTIPRGGGITYSPSNSKGSPRAGASSSAGSVASVGARESYVEVSSRGEKRRERRPRIVKFADDEQFLASINEEPDTKCDRRNSNEAKSKTRAHLRDSVNPTSGVKESTGRKSTSRKVKGTHRKSNEMQDTSSGDDVGQNLKSVENQDVGETNGKVSIGSNEVLSLPPSTELLCVADRSDQKSTPLVAEIIVADGCKNGTEATSDGNSLEILCTEPVATIRQSSVQAPVTVVTTVKVPTALSTQAPTVIPIQERTLVTSIQRSIVEPTQIPASALVMQAQSSLEATSSIQTATASLHAPAASSPQTTAAVHSVGQPDYQALDITSEKLSEICPSKSAVTSPQKPTVTSYLKPPVTLSQKLNLPASLPLKPLVSPPPKPAVSALNNQPAISPSHVPMSTSIQTSSAVLAQVSMLTPTQPPALSLVPSSSAVSPKPPAVAQSTELVASLSTPLACPVTALAKAFTERLLPKPKVSHSEVTANANTNE
ncbi:uncharacterized protein LOC111250717 [Varroa destructor]|uniref:Uncharacterized protein n=1 Tax=Varroa destructor TaxID=109461 RepID=A0A7M7K5S5_VARDE|nr:uncharacterized protein LOC111250717 [Varroa destructor]